jgi:uncharacterized protein YunC (DUF1805 family)
MLIEQIPLKNGVAQGLKFDMPHAPLLVIKAARGFVMCGYLDMAMANRLGDIAAKVTGVKTFEDVLNSKIIEASEEAKKLGIQEGITGREALEKMF